MIDEMLHDDYKRHLRAWHEARIARRRRFGYAASHGIRIYASRRLHYIIIMQEGADFVPSSRLLRHVLKCVCHLSSIAACDYASATCHSERRINLSTK